MPHSRDYADFKTNASAASYLEALMADEAEGCIGDDEWLNGLNAVVSYLRCGSAFPLFTLRKGLD